MRLVMPDKSWMGYAAAVVLPVAVLMFRLALGAGWTDQPLLILFAAPIAVSALIGGFLPGIVATVFSAGLVKYFLLLPLQTLRISSNHSAGLLFSLLIIGVLISALTAALRSQRGRLRNALQLADERRADHRASEERFAVVFHSVPLAIMVVRLADGHVVDVNSAFTDLWGYRRAEVVGRTSAQLQLWVEPAQLIQKLKENRHRDAQELQARHRSGAVRDVLLSVSIVYVEGSAHLLVTAADMTERNRARQMEHVAHHDTLTNLPNRLLLQAKLREALERTERTDAGSAVLFIDLDRFKAVNDSLGHRAGDELLRLVASRLRGRIRGHDTVARVGGDEFIVVLQELNGAQDAEATAADLIAHLSTPFMLSGGHKVCIGASVGLTHLTATANDVESLIQQADTALYDAKKNGRGIVRVYDSRLTARKVSEELTDSA